MKLHRLNLLPMFSEASRIIWFSNKNFCFSHVNVKSCTPVFQIIKWCDSWKVSITDLRDLSNIMDTSLGRTIVCLHDCYLFYDYSSYFVKVCFHLIADLFFKDSSNCNIYRDIIWKLSCNVDICKKKNKRYSTNEQFCPFSLLLYSNHLMVQSYS